MGDDKNEEEQQFEIIEKSDVEDEKLSNSYLKIQSSSISSALRKLENSDSGNSNGEELTQTDRMSILFLKEVFRELQAIIESARCVTFVCSTLDSKFFSTYGADITWELYNL